MTENYEQVTLFRKEINSHYNHEDINSLHDSLKKNFPNKIYCKNAKNFVEIVLDYGDTKYCLNKIYLKLHGTVCNCLKLPKTARNNKVISAWHSYIYMIIKNN